MINRLFMILIGMSLMLMFIGCAASTCFVSPTVICDEYLNQLVKACYPSKAWS